jgi:hypothetical protein
MTDHRQRPRLVAPRGESGLDVWLPALVAFIAAIFLVLSAQAADAQAAPRPIYPAERFDPATIAREAAETDRRAATATYAARPDAVIVAALPDLAAASRAPAARVSPAPDRAIVIGLPETESGVARLVAGAVIAALLLFALAALARTWRRSEPLAV